MSGLQLHDTGRDLAAALCITASASLAYLSLIMLPTMSVVDKNYIRTSNTEKNCLYEQSKLLQLVLNILVMHELELALALASMQ